VSYPGRIRPLTKQPSIPFPTIGIALKSFSE